MCLHRILSRLSSGCFVLFLGLPEECVPSVSQARTEWKASNGLYERLSLSHGYLNKKGYCNGNDCQVFPGTELRRISNPCDWPNSIAQYPKKGYAVTTTLPPAMPYSGAMPYLGAMPYPYCRADSQHIAVTCLHRLSPAVWGRSGVCPQLPFLLRTPRAVRLAK